MFQHIIDLKWISASKKKDSLTYYEEVLWKVRIILKKMDINWNYLCKFFQTFKVVKNKHNHEKIENIVISLESL